MLAAINSEDSSRSHSSAFSSDGKSGKSETKNDIMNSLLEEILPVEDLPRANKATEKKAADTKVDNGEDEKTSKLSVSIKSSSNSDSMSNSGDLSDLSENAFFNKAKEKK